MISFDIIYKQDILIIRCGIKRQLNIDIERVVYIATYFDDWIQIGLTAFYVLNIRRPTFLTLNKKKRKMKRQIDKSYSIRFKRISVCRFNKYETLSSSCNARKILHSICWLKLNKILAGIVTTDIRWHARCKVMMIDHNLSLTPHFKERYMSVFPHSKSELQCRKCRHHRISYFHFLASKCP